MKIHSFLSVSLVSMALVGCTAQQTQQSGISNQTLGTVAGGVGGALVGSAFGGGTGKLLAVGAGAVGGALVGNQVGKSYDKNNDNQNQ